MSEIVKNFDTRRAFVETLNELNDQNIIVVIPDVGFNYLDDPTNKFKVLNLGVTEASSMAIAGALALSGFKVFFYSMINFSLFRPAEMVRNSVVCHKAPVTILGVKGSSSYKFLGFSHNLLHEKEDIDFCNNIGLTWYVPESSEETKEVVKNAYLRMDKGLPTYIRL
jgi:transketolase